MSEGPQEPLLQIMRSRSSLRTSRKASVREHDLRISKLDRVIGQMIDSPTASGIIDAPVSLAPEVQQLIDDPLRGL